MTEAEALWWRAAGQEGKIATEALGSLARHYQVQRDAEGQYRVFRQLNLLQPGNAAVGNNRPMSDISVPIHSVLAFARGAPPIAFGVGSARPAATARETER